MNRRVFSLLAGILFAAAAHGTSPADRMDEVAQYYVNQQQFMGAVLVARGDQVLFSKAYGFANLEWNIPNTTTTKFRIGSVTKQFTAAAILLLAERGKLKLDDPIKNFCPDAPAAWDAVTLTHLLGHTSGIPSYTNTPDFEKLSASHATPQELVARVRDRALEFAPGSRFSYSNTGYVLLGMAIEKASGAKYADFLKRNIFDPLGLADTGYDDNEAILPKRASGYSPAPQGKVNAMHVDMSTPFAAGALYSTVDDLRRWQRALFDHQLLSKSSVEKMTSAGKGNYGFGLFIGDKAISHGGGIPGFNSRVAYYPATDVVVITLSNLNGPGAEAIGEKLGALAGGETVVLPPERRSISLKPELLQRYAGKYQLQADVELTFTVEDSQLFCATSGGGKFPLAAMTETEFFPIPFEAEFVFQKNKAGKITGVRLRQGGQDTLAPRKES